MAINYQVKVKQLNTVVFDNILANSEEEAIKIAEENAECEWADKLKEYKVTSQAFALEDRKVYIDTYEKSRRDIGDPVRPNYANIYEVRADYDVPEVGENYYQIRYFSPRLTRNYQMETCYHEENYPYKSLQYVRDAASNWERGIKKLDLKFDNDETRYF